MSKRIYKKLACISFLLVSVLLAKAQFTVTGGEGTPLQAKQDDRLAVYMVYGMENVEIRYSSASSSHQWYRYKADPLTDSQPVASTQEGTTSMIRDIEEGYGYYVAEGENIAMNNFIWLIDYSKYEFEINNAGIKDGDTRCEVIFFSGDINMPPIYYTLPNKRGGELIREIQLRYTTMREARSERRFVMVDTVMTIQENPFANFYIEAPLADTEFTFRGDQFARHFNREKTAVTETYQTIAVKSWGYMEIDTVSGGTNILAGQDSDSYSAPVEVRFTGYANVPVASLFNWRIKDENGSTITSFTGEEFSYTFLNKGTYMIVFEATSRPGLIQCTDSSFTATLKVRESDLQIPNVFTPGTSPGANDVFKVAYKSLISFKGWIFNRWGVQLFYWTDPNQGWDGKKGGKYLPPGTYFYVIEAKGTDGENFKRSGHINLIRPKNEQNKITEQ